MTMTSATVQTTVPGTLLLRDFNRRASLALALLFAVSLNGAPPVNDRCDNPIEIPNSGPFPYLSPPVDLTEATTDGDPPSPSCQGGAISRSVWYTFTPADTGTYRITTCSDSGANTTVPDTLMALYTSASGCGGPFTEVTDGCNDDFCGTSGLQSSLFVSLLSGTRYYLVVWQYGTGIPEPSESTVQIFLEQSLVPVNDTCATATPILLNQLMFGSTLGASNDYELSGETCFTGIGQDPVTGAGRDVVYVFTAPAAGAYSVRAFHYSVLSDLVLYVGGSCPDGPFPAVLTDCLGAANRSALSSAESVVCLPLASNQVAYVFVDDESSGNGGSPFYLEITPCQREIEPNNTATNANQLFLNLFGAIEPYGDQDMFSLGAPPPGSRLFAQVDGEAANIPDFDMRAVTATDTLEFDDDNNDSRFGDSSPNIGGAILDGNPVFLMVNYNNFFTLTEPYRLMAVVQPPLDQATPEAEPNNTLMNAQGTLNNYVYGQLDGPAPSQDIDLYHFNVDSGDLLFVGLDGDPLRDATPIDARLDLLDEIGNILLSANDGDYQSSTNTLPGSTSAFFPNSPAEALMFRAMNKGTFYVRVTIGSPAARPEGAGDYLLSISKNSVVGKAGTNSPPRFQNLSALSPILKGETTTIDGEVTDADLGQTHTVTIDWNDGSEPAHIPLWYGTSSFSASHIYPEPPPGPSGSAYSVVLSAVDNLGTATTTSVDVVVYQALPARFVSIQSQTDGSIRLELEGTPTVSYDVWSSSNLTDWSFLESKTAEGDGHFIVLDATQPRPSARFYRAVAP